ncbi:MAG: hypothetical protein ACE5OR_06910 [bacterium]
MARKKKLVRSDRKATYLSACLPVPARQTGGHGQGGSKDRDYVESKDILESFFKIPGETLIKGNCARVKMVYLDKRRGG